MKNRMHVLIGAALGVLVLAGAAVLATRPRLPIIHGGVAKATYYCPMHPSYTSDHPGDCPICNMRLVKQGALSTQHTAHSTQQSTSPKDICYLHQCPMVHQGKPCPMTVVAKPGEKVTCPICGTHIAEASPKPGGRKILYWTDPMIPGYQADGPGTSPMGMDLVPVYEEDTTGGQGASEPAPSGYAPVLLTPQKRQLIGVTVAPVEKRALTKTIRAVGVVAHDPELYQAQEEFIQAQQAWQQAAMSTIPEVTEQARRLVASSRLRLRHLGLSEDMIDEVGTWKEPDHRLLLGGAGKFWVYASIYEYEIPLVRREQSATIEVAAFPERAFAGMIKAIDPMLNPATRTSRIRIIVEDPEGLLKPEMYVNASISVNLGEVMAIPKEAVFATGQRQIVFVDKGQGLFEPRDVTLGAVADGYYEVTAGVREGEPVVTSGNFLIDSESRLKGALQDMGGGAHQHGQ